MRSSDSAWKAAALISALCLSAACVASSQWSLAAIALAPGALCLVGKGPTRASRSTIFLAASTALAAVGTHLQLPMPLLVAGTAAALAAWDLAHLADRLSHALSLEHRGHLQRSHLPSLVAAIASGLALAYLASIARLHLSFGVVSLLALVLVLALAGIPRAIKAGSRRS